MKIVIFYEKPGCTTNAKQKKLLRESGCLLIERNLLEHGMDMKSLRMFFDGMPVSEWFNPNAPKIKSGEVDTRVLSESAALELLMMEPILIRRPLMVVGRKKICGFDTDTLTPMIGRPLHEQGMESCSSPDERCN
jgi:nitrogenase-associated protein